MSRVLKKNSGTIRDFLRKLKNFLKRHKRAKSLRVSSQEVRGRSCHKLNLIFLNDFLSGLPSFNHLPERGKLSFPVAAAKRFILKNCRRRILSIEAIPKEKSFSLILTDFG